MSWRRRPPGLVPHKSQSAVVVEGMIVCQRLGSAYICIRFQRISSFRRMQIGVEVMTTAGVPERSAENIQRGRRGDGRYRGCSESKPVFPFEWTNSGLKHRISQPGAM
mmetsp:Transcript_38800/g.153250  ORF Transcript_38800/g.153250 Transcript_38800/m.153250 type:complete len:108 (+) Transcript_38800:3785-4108(+)